MCLICLDFDRGFMTIPEAVRALSERVVDEHTNEVKAKIKAKAIKEVSEMFAKIRPVEGPADVSAESQGLE